MTLTALNKAAWLSTIWTALEEWQEEYEGRAAVGTDTYEQRWDDICTRKSGGQLRWDAL